MCKELLPYKDNLRGLIFTWSRSATIILVCLAVIMIGSEQSARAGYVKQGAKETGHGVKKGWHETKSGVKKGASETSTGFKKGWHATKQGFKKVF